MQIFILLFTSSCFCFLLFTVLHDMFYWLSLICLPFGTSQSPLAGSWLSRHLRWSHWLLLASYPFRLLLPLGEQKPFFISTSIEVFWISASCNMCLPDLLFACLLCLIKGTCCCIEMLKCLKLPVSASSMVCMRICKCCLATSLAKKYMYNEIWKVADHAKNLCKLLFLILYFQVISANILCK